MSRATTFGLMGGTAACLGSAFTHLLYGEPWRALGAASVAGVAYLVWEVATRRTP